MDAVIFIGIQGSGKTTFYRQRFFETHVRLSLDMLKTRHRQRRLIEACVAARQRIVIDNSSVLASERAEYIRLAHAGGFTAHGYFFEPQVDRALVWNQQRSGKAAIPVKGLLGTLTRLERPSPQEGFNHLYRVRVNHAGAFVVEGWDSLD